MKDFLNKDLAIDDEVVVTPKNYRGLVKGKIVAFTKLQVRVLYLNTWNYGQPGEEENFITYPDTLIKIEK